MRYSNMTLDELVREAEHLDSDLSLCILRKYEEALSEVREDLAEATQKASYDDGWGDAVEEMEAMLQRI